MLAARDAGVDSCWLNRFDPDEAASVFGLPENEKAVMLLDLGYAAPGAGPLPPHSARRGPVRNSPLSLIFFLLKHAPPGPPLPPGRGIFLYRQHNRPRFCLY